MSMCEYQVGDNVLINSEEHKKKIVGCIEELDETDRTFTYGLYVYSKDIPLKQPYHGTYELFKTSSTFSDKVDNIERCVEVLKFKDYAMREQPPADRPFYMIRQYYDMQENTLTPEELKPCICGSIVNPDGNIIMCFNCSDLFYHDSCLQLGAKCTGCASVLKDDLTMGKRYSISNNGIPEIPTLQQSKSSKSQQLIDITEEETIEEIQPAKMQLDGNQMKEFFEQAKREKQARMKKQEELRKQQIIQMKAQQEQKALQPTQLKTQPSLKKENSASQLEFPNLTFECNEKIHNLVGRYKKFNPIGNSVGPDKKRMEVREKFFEYIVYGLVEFEQNESSLNDDEKKVLLQDTYEIARKLAVEIESNVFNINNQHNKYALKEGYKNRCKLLFVNLKDSLNFNFRRRIINKQLKPQQLCTMTEVEMYNPTKLQEIEQQKMKILNRDTIQLSDKILILKTNKGEEYVDLREDKEPEVTEELKAEGEANIYYDPSKNQRQHSLQSNPNNTTPSHSDVEEKNGKHSHNLIGSSEQIHSESSIDAKTIRNPFYEQNLVESLSSFIGDKAIKRLQERLYADLPEKEAKYLSEKLFS